MWHHPHVIQTVNDIIVIWETLRFSEHAQVLQSIFQGRLRSDEQHGPNAAACP